MAGMFTFLVAFVALSVSAWAQEAAVCGAPKPLDDGWVIAAPAAVGLDASCAASTSSSISGRIGTSMQLLSPVTASSPWSAILMAATKVGDGRSVS
ncbi:MAG: hypothetical protein JSR91_21595 [Proteobacteria bacterium]|nr:hypothetical protein [Pseudomonadota bacterium]